MSAKFDEYRISDSRRFVARIEDELRYVGPDEPVPGLDAIEGSDESGTVYCVIRLDGTPVQVGITDGWWEAVGPRAVAAAVLQAYAYAQQKANFARLVLDEQGRSITNEPAPRRSSYDDEPEPVRDDTWKDSYALQQQVSRVMGELDEAIKRFDQVLDPPERELAGPRGMFRAVVKGPEIIRAYVNEYGLRRDDADELAQDARDVLVAARPTHAN